MRINICTEKSLIYQYGYKNKYIFLNFIYKTIDNFVLKPKKKTITFKIILEKEKNRDRSGRGDVDGVT